jgi:hypothetical protein
MVSELFCLSVTSLFVMLGRRLYRRRSCARHRSDGISRYVTDTIALNRDVLDGTQRACIVALTPTAGIRKVGRFRLELSCDLPVMFPLIYFPEGINPTTGALNSSPGDAPTRLDTPEQHFVTSGIIRDSTMTIAHSNRGRSLSNGDSMWLLVKPFVYADGHIVYANVTYSIAFG